FPGVVRCWNSSAGAISPTRLSVWRPEALRSIPISITPRPCCARRESPSPIRKAPAHAAETRFPPPKSATPPREPGARRRGVGTGNHEPIDFGELAGLADIYRFGAGALHRRAMGREIALQGKDADLLFFHYQPRVCSSSDAGIFATSRPGIASPSKRLASSSF